VLVVGLTACVPPLDCMVYELPSLPVTVTVVALLALTVNVAVCPAVMLAGAAVTVMVGGVWVLLLDELTRPPPHPVITMVQTRPVKLQKE
jgi:hypothetical protein